MNFTVTKNNGTIADLEFVVGISFLSTVQQDPTIWQPYCPDAVDSDGIKQVESVFFGELVMECR